MVPQSICVLRLSAIGDVCHAVSVVQAIQRYYPAAHITWVIGQLEARLLEGLPGVEFVVFDKRQGWKAYRRLWQTLAGRQFDVLLHMQVALRANLASLCIPAKRKIGFDWHSAKELHALFMRHRIEPLKQPHVLENFQQFARAIGVQIKRPQWHMPLTSEARLWAAQQLGDAPRTLIICPAASNEERNWLPERYAAVADYAAAKGFRVVLCGGPAATELQLAKEIQEHSAVDILDLVGQTDLKQLLALIERASLVLAPDTGPAHMATTVATPVIGLYGHSNPGRTGPYLCRHYVVEAYHQTLQEQTGRTADQLPWGVRVKGEDIMAKIPVEAVCAMFDRVVDKELL